MNEYESATKIKDGLLPSPWPIGNSALWALRISGTGSAERPTHDEAVYRPPEIWTSEEMLKRAAGLPVLMGHPPKGVLDSKEYCARAIGSIILPYAREGELWGVARIFDTDAAAAMASGGFSTSPGVAFQPGEAVQVAGEDGTLTIETSPSLLDHVAIVPNEGDTGGGVWDRGGPAAGIRNDSTRGQLMDNTEDSPKAEIAADKIDKMLSALDAVTQMCGSMGKRLDAIEKRGAPALAVEDAIVEPRKPNSMTAHPMTAQAAADLEKREEGEKYEAQYRADQVSHVFGERAPPPLAGETLRAYRVRLARRFKRFSKEFSEVNLDDIRDPKVFDGVETRIYADALAIGSKGIEAPVGTLREVIKKGPGGREFVEFFGSPSVWLDDFRPPRQTARFIPTNERG